MSISRHNAIVRGPAVVQFSWQTGSGSSLESHTYMFRTAGDVVFTPETQVFNIPSSELGTIDRRATELMANIRFTPIGMVDSTAISLLWPHLTKFPGQSLFGANDMSVKVWPVAGAAATPNDSAIVVLVNACVSQMPSISLSPTRTSIGEVVVRGILADDALWEADSHWYLTSGAAPTLSALDPASIPTVPALLSWGDMTNIRTREGVTVEFDMSTQDEIEDEGGVYDITLTDLVARARFTPVAGFDVSALATALHVGDDLVRGGSVYRANMTATAKEAGGLIVTLFSASLLTAPMNYGATTGRFGELVLEGLRGTGNAAATVAIATAQTAAPRSAAATTPATPATAQADTSATDGDGEETGT